MATASSSLTDDVVIVGEDQDKNTKTHVAANAKSTSKKMKKEKKSRNGDNNTTKTTSKKKSSKKSKRRASRKNSEMSSSSEGESTVLTILSTSSSSSSSSDEDGYRYQGENDSRDVHRRIARIDPPATSRLEDQKKTVSFGAIHLDEFEYVIGPHLVTKIGPPITIADKPFSSKTYTVDEYESERNNNSGSGNNNQERDLLLSARNRILLLQKLGYTQNEIQDAVNESERVRNQRKRSVLNQQYDGLAFATELFRRKAMKVVPSMSLTLLKENRTTASSA